MLKIYLDNCCYNRPFDDLTLEKNRLEANAKLFIQSLIKYKSIALIYSFMSLVEIEDSPFEDNKAYILSFIEANATAFVGKKRLSEIEQLSNDIMQTGIKKKDATHLACAIVAGCDYLITTDKRLLKHKTDKTRIINPIEFVGIWRGLQ